MARGIMVMRSRRLTITSGPGLQDRHCRALWQAAGDAKRRHEKMEVTGRCFATCRHVMPLKAVNLIRSGERYGYSHYLLTDIFYDMNRALEAAHSSVDVLPDMHGLLHAWPCQVKYGAGWAPGMAAGSGEESEQLFSFLSRLAYTTRNMGMARSNDSLTAACLRWGERKRSTMAQALRNRYVRMTHLLEDAKVELQADLIRLWPELPQESSQGNIAPLKQTLRNMADGTNKKKAQIDRKIQGTLRDLDALLKQYHELLPHGSTQRLQVERDQLTQTPPHFPWVDEMRPGQQHCLQGISVYDAFHLNQPPESWHPDIRCRLQMDTA
ncbi:hypothetical protein WJX84_009883 [Apatococcus fuscideae]|uniref:Uncharacterized protein n=1 Tax=Apatococcus fuscideae TaxID=2026836 RepID=A0AAW1T9G4_9CHLO